jgi:branched-chain amino acid transport system permease protein
LCKTRGFKFDFLPILFVVVIAVLLVLVEAVTQNQFYLGVFTLITMYAVLAMSWDILSGVTGYLNFGLAFPFGVGGYTAAYLWTAYKIAPVEAIALSGLSAVFFGFLIGAPSLRLKGHYFIMVTLLVPIATSEFLDFALVQDGSIFGVNAVVNNTSFVYNASVVIFALTGIALCAVAYSRLGLVLRSIKDDEVSAQALGIKTTRYKLIAFSLSNLFSGMIGAVYVFSNGVASPTNFGLLFSALPVFMCALGGIGTIVGGVIGAFILEGAIDFLRISYIQDARLLISATLLVVILLFFPKGIWGYVRGESK